MINITDLFDILSEGKVSKTEVKQEVKQARLADALRKNLKKRKAKMLEENKIKTGLDSLPDAENKDKMIFFEE